MFVLDTLLNRLRLGQETLAWPDAPGSRAPDLPDRHGGALRLNPDLCPEGCKACLAGCPTEAIRQNDRGRTELDLGACLFCSACVQACPSGAVAHTQDPRLATRTRQALLIGGGHQRTERELAQALDKRLLKLFGRSLKLRQVSAGGCNACEADTNVLNTIGWDLSRFGIQFVASPRHADGLLVTGPVSEGMALALRKTWEAMPEPKLVIAVGACAISGGPFVGHSETRGGCDTLLPVDLYIPGCPPHPLTILDGLLRLLDRLPDKA